MPKSSVSDETILCVGKIAILWSRIEHHFDQIIWSYTDLETRIGEVITGLLATAPKAELLLKLVDKIEGTEDTADKLIHLVRCREICSHNRNLILHGVFIEGAGTGLMLKSHKLGGFAVFQAEVPRLEKVASQIASVYEFCRDLDFFVWEMVGRPRSKKPTPSPAKPPLPEKLSPLQGAKAERVYRHPLDFHPGTSSGG